MPRQSIPRLWLLSDERNEATLELALRHLPRGSALVFRHYHLPPDERRVRFSALAAIARRQGHLTILADNIEVARAWGADGFYGPPAAFGIRAARAGLLAIATVHNMREVAMANRMDADAALLSPVFATRSHPGAKTLGPVRFRLIARHAAMPVIALGGMSAARARRLAWPCWAAIDGLSGARRASP